METVNGIKRLERNNAANQKLHWLSTGQDHLFSQLVIQLVGCLHSDGTEQINSLQDFVITKTDVQLYGYFTFSSSFCSIFSFFFFFFPVYILLFKLHSCTQVWFFSMTIGRIQQKKSSFFLLQNKANLISLNNQNIQTKYT